MTRSRCTGSKWWARSRPTSTASTCATGRTRSSSRRAAITGSTATGWCTRCTSRDGTATYRNRWIAHRRASSRERDAGAPLWRGIIEPFGANPADEPEKDTANTDLVFHNERLLALWYRAGKPYALDPVTLETLGAGRLRRHAALRGLGAREGRRAHRRAVLLRLRDEAAVHALRRRRAGRRGAPLRRRSTCPGPRLPHDMAITERYSILMDLPLVERPRGGARRAASSSSSSATCRAASA